MRARRHNDILDRIHRDHFVSVSDLAKDFGVAESTIRRDLDDLEKKALIRRDYGGAVFEEKWQPEPPFQERQILRKPEKEAVARRAAELIHDGETIFIDGGTTTEFIIPHILSRKNLVVVTCGFNIAMRLLSNPQITTIIVGGIVDPVSQSIVSLHSPDISQLQHIRVEKSFISAVGVSAEFGITNAILDRIPTKIKALEIAGESYVVVDGSKIGAVAVGLVAPIARVNAVITDSTAVQKELDKIEAAGVRTLVAEVKRAEKRDGSE